MEALHYPGGNGAEGAARLLVKHATVALLNASHPDVNCPLSCDEAVAIVNDALANRDQKTMLNASTR